jgi:hypothetical protein
MLVEVFPVTYSLGSSETQSGCLRSAKIASACEIAL